MCYIGTLLNTRNSNMFLYGSTRTWEIWTPNWTPLVPRLCNVSFLFDPTVDNSIKVSIRNRESVEVTLQNDLIFWSQPCLRVCTYLILQEFLLDRTLTDHLFVQIPFLWHVSRSEPSSTILNSFQYKNRPRKKGYSCHPVKTGWRGLLRDKHPSYWYTLNVKHLLFPSPDIGNS